MNLDEYLNNNLDDILENSDKYVSSNKSKKLNKKVLINETNNDIFEIEKIVKQTQESLDIDDLDEKEYLEYNQEYYDASNEYYDINYYNEVNYDEDNEDENNEDKNNEDIKYKTSISIEEPTEDNCEDDIIDELYEKIHQSLQLKNEVNETYETNNKSIQDLLAKSHELTHQDSLEKYSELPHQNLLSNDNGEYFINLMNIFIKYYNNKFDKIEHFFSNVKDVDKGTTNQMELFFDAILEFKMFVECMQINSIKAMEHLYKETEPEKISKLFEKWDKQIYMFELDELKLFSPSLIVCLNYIYEKDILNDDWNIYNLRDN